MISLNAGEFSAELEAIQRKLMAALVEAMREGARVGADVARQKATPGIAKTIRGVAEPDNFALEAVHPAAVFVEQGTRAHVITGSPLVFRVAGRTVFATRVQHPGTKAAPFLQPGLEAGAAAFSDSFERLFVT